MSKASKRRIVVTHWNAGVYHRSSTPHVLPELLVGTLLYDEILIREEDLITNRAITGLLSKPESFGVFTELLRSGLVRLLRLPPEQYPSGRKFDPLEQPLRARAEEHQERRTYKGKSWSPTQGEWKLFRDLDVVLSGSQLASRYHAPFPKDVSNPFAAQLDELLCSAQAYGLDRHPAFRRLHPDTTRQFIEFCRNPGSWLKFLRRHGVANPIVGPDGGFFRSAAYQCSEFLPSKRAVRRLVESVYAATYCDRENADGRYGGSDLVEMPFRYSSEGERRAAASAALRVDVVPADASVELSVVPGIVDVILRTRESPEFEAVRQAMRALGRNEESPLLTESRFKEAWSLLSRVYAEHFARMLSSPLVLEHQMASYVLYVFLAVRAVGLLAIQSFGHFEPAVLLDYMVAHQITMLGPELSSAIRAAVKVPALQSQMERAAVVRCSPIALAPLSPLRSRSEASHEVPSK